ncbi:MAG: Gfo/Idh/MocA family oxidoreductase [Bacteroidales bacterium]|nr:Gfo/Idh/MocA family oxidoreductase [Bacteroidales bacterium]
MKKIRVATIGTSHIATSFVAAARHDTRFEYAAAYSRDRNRGSEFAARHGAERVVTSLEELAGAPDIDAVYIASPNTLHAQQAIAMMRGGKHVLCEKPVAISPEEVQAMIDTARKHKVAFMEAMKTTLLPNFFQVRKALGRIGKIRRFTANFCQYSSKYDQFQNGVVASAFNPQMKGGALRDLGVYGIAPMLHLFGTPWEGEFSEEKLKQTVTVQKTLVYPGGDTDLSKGIDGQGTMTVRYPSMEAVITYSKITDSNLPSEIQGENGTILIDRLSQMTHPTLVMRNGVGSRGDSGFHNGLTREVRTTEVEDLSVETLDDNMFYEIKEFFDIIESGALESAENTFERALNCARICSADRFALTR